jgi:hypothetical protein
MIEMEFREDILHTVLDHWNTYHSKISGYLFNGIVFMHSGVNFAVSRVYIQPPRPQHEITTWSLPYDRNPIAPRNFTHWFRLVKYM